MPPPIISPRCAVLQTLRSRGRPTYAAALIEHVTKITAQRVRLHDGSVYPTLGKLLTDGLITEVDAPESPVDAILTRNGAVLGHPARYYALTPQGAEVAAADAAALRALLGEG